MADVHPASAGGAAACGAAGPVPDPALAGVPAFLCKAHALISNPAHAAIVCWTPHGNSFVIKDAERFAGEICPAVFRHKNLGSFIRQLHLYGFSKVQGNKGALEFAHPTAFHRDNPSLMFLIRRRATAAAASANEAESKVLAAVTRVAMTNAEVTALARARDDVTDQIQWFRADRERMHARLDALAQQTAGMRAELAAERAKHAEIQATVLALSAQLLGGRIGGPALPPAIPTMAGCAPAAAPRPTRMEFAAAAAAFQFADAAPSSAPDSGRAWEGTRKRRRCDDDDDGRGDAKRARMDGVTPLGLVDAIWESGLGGDLFWDGV
eukprot:c48102_g1_i1.p1 GENE.c48102_g1_i1~~c48102_g1_i1.p1  ORF type:complete len:324 (+),score=45.27 c48102_g1_i1:345-1316(+)